MPPKNAGKRVRATALLAIIVAAGLIGIKAMAWMLTGSVAMLSALVDSVLDLSLSVMNFFAIRHAQTPADREHRFGHGKAEALAALAQGVMIAGAAVFLLVQAVDAFLDPRPLGQSTPAIIVMLISLVVTFFLVLVQRRAAAQTQSIAIAADSAHYASDVFMNIGVIVALVLSGPLQIPYADPLCGVIVAFILANSARSILARATDQLMDKELDDETRNAMRDIVLAHPQVNSLHDLRTRRAGLYCFVQCHIELDGSISLAQAHDISDAVEDAIMRAFPNAEVLIHQDPMGAEHITPLEKG